MEKKEQYSQMLLITLPQHNPPTNFFKTNFDKKIIISLNKIDSIYQLKKLI